MSNSVNELPVTTVNLSREDKGLGINIRGGVDAPHIPGDTGIFVSKVRTEGAVFKDGRIQEGDKIISLNGKSLNGVTHNEAVECFMKAGEEVVLEVQHGAQADILRRRMRQKEEEELAKQAPPKSSSLLKTFVFIGIGIGVVTVGIFAFKKYRPFRS